MIQILTVSPAIDLTYRVDRAEIGSQHRVLQTVASPGGKGGNVARVASSLGADVKLLAPLGGSTGAWYRESINAIGIRHNFVPAKAATRQCITVVDGASATEFNESPPKVSQEVLRTIIDSLESAEITVVAGSFPPEMPRAQIEALYQRVRKLSETLIVDTSGVAQQISLNFADFVTPNRRELSELGGTENFSAAFNNVGPSNPLVTVGEHGVVFDQSAPRVLAAPPQVGNPTGAGDAFVAGFAAAFNRGIQVAVANGVAVSAASVRESTAGEIRLDVVDALLAEVREEPYAPHLY